MPHTAAPGATFNINRYPSQHHTQALVEEDDGQYIDFQSHHAGYAPHNRGVPMTAAVDGPNFAHLMAQRGLNPNSVPFSPMMNQTNHAQNNAFQMQMLQLEMMKIQAAQAQAQQLQAEMYAQAQRQQQQAQARRTSVGYVPPATAGPLNNSFDLRSAALSAQMRRASQVEQVKSQPGGGAEDSVPMTAALGGRFGSRSLNGPTPMTRAISEEFNNETAALPSTPNATTVISGGTPLGTPSLNGKMAPNATSKSDSVSTWRRGGNNNSVLSGKLRPAPSVTITPPPNEPETQMLPTPTVAKSRPIPLRFNGATTQPLAAVAIDTSDEGEFDETSSSDSAASGSSPSTPSSMTSHGVPLSPREEASKKLYEGLGIGRPASSNSQSDVPVIVIANHRMVSQPSRQPRGPPSGADELGPKNFATRIRRQAIDGLGFLMNSRERRELVEAF